jgi:protein translocase SecG subunit
MNLLSTAETMGPIEIASAILLVLACLFIIIIVFFQGGSKPGLSQTMTGQSSDNYYQKNSGRSKEMRMKKFTVVAAVIFFVVAIGVNVVAVHFPDIGRTSTSQSDTQ